MIRRNQKLLREAFRQGYKDGLREAVDAELPMLGKFSALRDWLRTVKDSTLVATYQGKEFNVIISADGAQLTLMNKRGQKALTIPSHKVDFINDSLITLKSGDKITLKAYGEYAIPVEVFANNQ